MACVLECGRVMVTSCFDFPPSPPPPFSPFSPREGGPGVTGLVPCDREACFEPGRRERERERKSKGGREEGSEKVRRGRVAQEQLSA